MRRLVALALVLIASGAALAQGQATPRAIDGTWTLDRATRPPANQPATDVVITTSSTEVTIHRHWTSDAGVGEGVSSTDVFPLGGREVRASDGRMGTASMDGGVLTLTLTLTRVSTSPLQPPGEYRTVTREIYRASGDRMTVERAIYGVRPGEAPGRGPMFRFVYSRAIP